MNDIRKKELIECWHALGKNLCTGDPKIICEPKEGEDQQYMRVYYANDVWFKDATHEAFQGLLTRCLIEEGSFGRFSKKRIGWVINSAGRQSIGRFDVKGKPLLRRVNNDSIIIPRELPTDG